MKLTHIILVTLLFTIQASQRSSLQEFLDGIFEQNQLTSPQDALSCFDDNSIKIIFNMINSFLDKSVNISYEQATYLDQIVIVALENLPQEQADCFIQNAAFVELDLAYGMGASYPYNALSKINLHFKYNWLEASPNFNIWNAEWRTQNYREMGYDVAEFLHQMLP